MTLLSLDLSTTSTGYTIFNEQEKPIECGTICPKKTDHMFARIDYVVDSINELIIQHRITNIVVQQVHPQSQGKNLNTLKVLMYLQCGLMRLLYQNYQHIDVCFMLPNTWRKYCGIQTRGIHRNIVKQNDVKFAKQQYNMQVNDDIADSLGLGYAYFNK